MAEKNKFDTQTDRGYGYGMNRLRAKVDIVHGSMIALNHRSMVAIMICVICSSIFPNVRF